MCIYVSIYIKIYINLSHTLEARLVLHPTHLGASPGSATGPGCALEHDGGDSVDPPAPSTANMCKKGAPAAQGMFSITSHSGVTDLPTPLLRAQAACASGACNLSSGQARFVSLGAVFFLLTAPQRLNIFIIYLYSMKWKTLLESRTCFSFMASIF